MKILIVLVAIFCFIYFLVKCYIFCKRKKVIEIEVGKCYITKNNQVIKITEFCDINWGKHLIHLGGIDQYGVLWDTAGERLNKKNTKKTEIIKLYELSERDKKKYWPQIIGK